MLSSFLQSYYYIFSLVMIMPQSYILNFWLYGFIFDSDFILITTKKDCLHFTASI
jgi:hypothetical protein